MKLKLQLGVEVVVEVRVQLLFQVGGWRGGSEKNKINAILNSVGVKVEVGVGVELGKNSIKVGWVG